jgi:GT2 family glycosyltransferase
MQKDDEFLLINNDGCEIEKFSVYKKISIIQNEQPLSFAENVNQGIAAAMKRKKNLVFLNNDIIFTDNWFYPLKAEENNISIPVCNQLFPYHSDCGNLKLKVTMKFDDFKENYDLLNEIVKKHKKKFKPDLKFQGLLMPFYCFKAPHKILSEVGYFDQSFGVGGGEDIDYRIRCAIKGYETNFLLDSYILHFHGKSTWDGAETKFQTETRNEIYIEAFKKKWGIEMTQLFILRKNFSNFLSEKDLEDLFKQGKFSELIRRAI